MPFKTKEEQSAYYKEWRKLNKEKLQAYHKEWKIDNKDKINKSQYKYLLKLKLDGKRVNGRSLNAWAEQVKDKTPFCEWCYSEDSLEAHHIMPKIKFKQYALDINNGRTMCKDCHITCHKQGGY
jgi:hypothetical protein